MRSNYPYDTTHVAVSVISLRLLDVAQASLPKPAHVASGSRPSDARIAITRT